MSIVLRYDRLEDRFRLGFKNINKISEIFWLKRNLCISLLIKINELFEEANKKVPPEQIEKYTKKIADDSFAISEQKPVDIDKIQLHKDNENINLILFYEKKK
jgi:hypothetical protein